MQHQLLGKSFTSSSPMEVPEQNGTKGKEVEPSKGAQYDAIISALPREKSWDTPLGDLVHYQGLWYFKPFLEGVMSAQDHFQAQPEDTIIASAPKTGTTWLKSLAFSIVTRSRFDDSTSPLLTKVSHDCVPFMEFDLGEEKMSRRKELGHSLVATHMAYASLPGSILSSGCKIVYIWRDLKDVFVSLWFSAVRFMAFLDGEVGISLEEGFDLFCKGTVCFGPYWDHILGYWKASLDNPDKFLFLRYEELRKNTETCVNELAEFLGCPFSLEEEKRGMVEKIIKFCSFDNLSKLEVNINGMHREGTPREIGNDFYFRKGEIGDWKNHLTPEMAAGLDEIAEQKFRGTGLI